MKQSYKIAVIFPSRGMAFSQTCEELLDNLEGYDWQIFSSHGLPIPECFNKPLERALHGRYSGSYTHFFFVEDDMILPKDTLKKLLAENVPAITCDYPMDARGKAAVFSDPDGNVIFGGTGCLLVTREFLKAYKKPIFHSDIAWDMKVGETVELKPREVKGNLYGLHDVNFYLEAYQRGTPIKLSKVKCGQRKLNQLGASGTNIGQHAIDVWLEVEANQLPPIPKSSMMNIELDGEIVNVPVGSKLAKGHKPRYVEFLE